jgi:DNA-3-methyladenine glycosylase II
LRHNAELLKVKGIGAWTADIYLLRALRRPDAWPAGDLALMIAAQEVKRLVARPSAVELVAAAERDARSAVHDLMIGDVHV